MQLRSGAAEQAAAAGAEQRVAAEQHARRQIGDVGCSVSGHVEHGEAQALFGEHDLVPVADAVRELRNRLAGGTIYRDVATGRQRGEPADMVGVMVRDEDRGQLQTVLAEVTLDDVGVARIDDRSMVSHLDEPDIVILKSRERDDSQGVGIGMTSVHGSDDWSDWLATPQGQYLLKWEEAKLDAMVADIFGYNAVQIGLPDRPLLRASRISHRVVAARASRHAQVLTEAHALPFATASIDLVLLAHVLEFSRHPHEVLREVERVLVPEGSVIVAGFNPFSLFGLRRALARNRSTSPWSGHYFTAMRIRDWLELLGFETEPSSYGCYAPPMRSTKWIERWRFMDRAGDRWWPVFGGVYVLHGVKRVQGMRLIMPKWRDNAAPKKGLSPIARRDRKVARNLHETH